MTNTKYGLYQEKNRLTLVIDNPTEETAAMIMKLMGAGIKDLTGLNPVKQEETSVPERKPDVQKTVAQEQEERKEENADAGTQEKVADDAAVPPTGQNSKYSYEELLEIVKSNKRIAEIGPVEIAVAIHPYLTDDEQRLVLINMCGKTPEEVAGDKILTAFKSVCSSTKDMIPLANGYVRLLRSKEKQSGQQK
ncbi:MAG: hypothetical protein SPL82_00700 [Lachnospiraceae bacterium]|nr:hypothetical protein [Lachnospiraceae bacterium]